MSNNYSNSLSKQSLVNRFAPVVVKDSGHRDKRWSVVVQHSGSKHEQIKLVHIQRQIMASLVDLSKEFWIGILNDTGPGGENRRKPHHLACR